MQRSRAPCRSGPPDRMLKVRIVGCPIPPGGAQPASVGPRCRLRCDPPPAGRRRCANVMPLHDDPGWPNAVLVKMANVADRAGNRKQRWRADNRFPTDFEQAAVGIHERRLQRGAPREGRRSRNPTGRVGAHLRAVLLDRQDKLLHGSGLADGPGVRLGDGWFRIHRGGTRWRHRDDPEISACLSSRTPCSPPHSAPIRPQSPRAFRSRLILRPRVRPGRYGAPDSSGRSDEVLASEGRDGANRTHGQG